MKDLIEYRNQQGEAIAEYNEKFMNIYSSKAATQEDLNKFKLELEQKGYKVLAII